MCAVKGVMVLTTYVHEGSSTSPSSPTRTRHSLKTSLKVWFSSVGQAPHPAVLLALAHKSLMSLVWTISRSGIVSSLILAWVSALLFWDTFSFLGLRSLWWDSFQTCLWLRKGKRRLSLWMDFDDRVRKGHFQGKQRGRQSFFQIFHYLWTWEDY